MAWPINIFISNDFTYTANGTATEGSQDVFDISVSGNLNLTTSNSSINTLYTSVTYGPPITAILNADGTLSFGSGASGPYSDISFCSSGGSFITDPTTLTPEATSESADADADEVGLDPSVTSSSTVTELALFNTQIQSTISDISDHIFSFFSGTRLFGFNGNNGQFKMEGAIGLNAGDGAAIPYGVWGSYSYADYENDLSSTAFEGNNHSFLGGTDLGFWENTVLGVAFGYGNGDIDTTFNGGQQDTDSYTIAPYFGALLTDQLSVDFNVGYSRVDYDQFRTVTGSTTQITSSPFSDRWFGAFNLNGITYYNNWIIGGRLVG
ncbi:MAG: autotransporter domain-containing protein [Proteobacteria bacterium]|nr:autotransporter domain-containing protein [Pseudomonadota bacterium]